MIIEKNNVYNLDCIDGLKLMEKESVDCILIDPPYFLPANHYQTRKQFSRNFADLGILEHFFKDVFKELQRVIKKEGVIYVFCDGQSYPLFYYHLYPFCKSVRPLIWDKKTSINGYSWRHQHELIIFAEMPLSKPVPTGDGDILRFSAVKVNNRIHPAEKPIDLLKTLILKSTKENDLILDCFSGSGSTLIACIDTHRNYVGFEKGLEYYNESIKRIKAHVPTQHKLEGIE
jgi:site-specific DNA-methyltransferase (adenine-specific)